MKKIIITGATSFIGVNLINELLKEEAEIYAVVRPDSSKIKRLPKSDKIRLIQLDMTDYDRLADYINRPCDCLIHLAWEGTRGNDRMDALVQTKSYQSAMDIIEEAIKLKCGTIISAGSQAEYGSYGYPITEDTQCNPNTEYGIYKLKFFRDAGDICRKNSLNFKEPRFFSLYGPGDYDDTMVIATLKKMLNNEICEFTESIQMWDFLFISDAVRGIIKLIDLDCPDGAYNFGSGNSKPLKSFIEEMYELTGSKSKLLFGALPYPKTGMVSITPIVEKLKSETGWMPEISFRDGILTTLKNMKK